MDGVPQNALEQHSSVAYTVTSQLALLLKSWLALPESP
jgi:hypothetical protein